VSISAGQRFIPPTIRVKLHQTIIWRNFSTTEQTVTGDTGGPKSDVLKRLDTYRYSFEKTGTYTYHSEKKPDMKGTIIVEK
jgi:plastocyanin